MNANLARLCICITVFILTYFFSFQIQKVGKAGLVFLSQKIGTFSKTSEFTVKRYVFLHRSSPITKLYNWINEQLIGLGLKRVGVTPFGYFTFWSIISVFLSLFLIYVINITILATPVIYGGILTMFLVLTRVIVSEKMEKREADVMDAIDLIIPDIGGGVKNAILMYVDNFAPSLQSDFKVFVSNIQDRGYSFSDAMFILSDSLGMIFRDFAQKAIFFENLGEPDMVDIFADIIETNRLRRELRYKNNVEFGSLKASFLTSTGIVIAYFFFILATDEFSRNFFLHETVGNILLVISIIIVFSVLSYITTIKSRAL